MPRAGQLKPPAGERLPDRIAIGLLTVTFPPELVDRVVAEAGRVQRRSRLLPARVVVYYVLAMCLFSGQGYEEVARLLTGGLAYARRWQGTWRVPTTAAITRARARLGPEPLSHEFDAASLARACRGKKTPLKVALLDQHVVAGLGNIYASEALHLAAVSPMRREIGRAHV